MSALSDYLENKLLDHLLKATAYTRPATVYLALFTSDPGEAGTTGEVSGGSYARVAITNNNTSFPACATTGTPTKTLSVEVAFPTATASWGTVTHWAIFDVASGTANMLTYGKFGTARTVAIGKTPKLAAGSLSLTLVNGSTGGLTLYSQRKLLDHVFGGPTFTVPTTVYLGLSTGASGETLTEWSDSSYTRQDLTVGSAAAGVIASTGTETFSAAVVDADVTLTHYGIWDDVSVGNLLVYGSLNTPRSVAVGDSVTLAVGACTLTAN